MKGTWSNGTKDLNPSKIWQLVGNQSSVARIAFVYANLRCGCGSKNRYQNGTLVSANMDQTLRFAPAV